MKLLSTNSLNLYEKFKNKSSIDKIFSIKEDCSRIIRMIVYDYSLSQKELSTFLGYNPSNFNKMLSGKKQHLKSISLDTYFKTLILLSEDSRFKENSYLKDWINRYIKA